MGQKIAWHVIPAQANIILQYYIRNKYSGVQILLASAVRIILYILSDEMQILKNAKHTKLTLSRATKIEHSTNLNNL